MRRRMMKSKIHRATVTGADLDYVGSISLDPELMKLADIREYEQVAVLDIDNGARFETYAILGGPGEVCLNGAAARLVHRGDKVIVLTYAEYEEAELEEFVPRVVFVDSSNRSVDRGREPRSAARLAERLAVRRGPADRPAHARCGTATHRRVRRSRGCSTPGAPGSRRAGPRQRGRGPLGGRPPGGGARTAGRDPDQGRALPVGDGVGAGRASRRSSAATRTRPTCTWRTPSRAGAGLCDDRAVRVLVDEGPLRVRELIGLGAVFDSEDRRRARASAARAGTRPRGSSTQAGRRPGPRSRELWWPPSGTRRRRFSNAGWRSI